MQNKCVGHQQLSVDGTAGGVSLTVPTDASAAVFRVKTNPIWWTADGTTPSTTNGDPASVGDIIQLTGRLSSFRAIRQSGTGALDISYWSSVEDLPTIITASASVGSISAASTIADGADVNAGSTTDAAITSSTTGTMSGKLRGLVGWAYTRMPAALGQTTASGSLPVVLASDQAPPAFTLGSGEKQGSATSAQFATITTKWVKVKAQYDNAGRVYIGTSTSVTKADGTTDTTAGWQLIAGDETPWLPISNLNQLWLICDNAGDDTTYIYLV